MICLLVCVYVNEASVTILGQTVLGELIFQCVYLNAVESELFVVVQFLQMVARRR